MLDTSFCVARRFCLLFTLSKKRLSLIFCFRFSSALPGVPSAADTQRGSFAFLIDPTPYRVLRCNPTSDSLMVFPAMGSKKSAFFAPKSTVLTPSKNLQSLAINTEPMDCELPLSSPSNPPPPVSPDIADFGTMTTPIQTSSVSCYTDSFEKLEFAALLKNNESVETLEQVLADTRKELGAQKALIHGLEIALEKQTKLRRHTAVPRRKDPPEMPRRQELR